MASYRLVYTIFANQVEMLLPFYFYPRSIVGGIMAETGEGVFFVNGRMCDCSFECVWGRGAKGAAGYSPNCEVGSSLVYRYTG